MPDEASNLAQYLIEGLRSLHECHDFVIARKAEVLQFGQDGGEIVRNKCARISEARLLI